MYLLKMGVNLQSLFRQNGHVKGYFGEIYLSVTYFFWFIYLFSTQIIIPVVIFKIFTKEDYSCSEDMKHWLSFIDAYEAAVFPLLA
jgi:hypothetical protein